MIYLDELRSSIIRAISVYATVVFALIYRGDFFLGAILKPVRDLFPHLIFTHVFSPIVVQIKLAFVLGGFLLLPYWLAECWRFIRSALYPSERLAVFRLLMASGMMFYLGAGLGWFFLLPELIQIAKAWSIVFVTQWVDVAGVLDMIYLLLAGSGLFFQLPIFMLALARMRIISLQQCQQGRKYACLLALIIGMIVTPPDVIAQVIVAIPLYVLFEFGVLLIKWMGPGQFHNDESRVGFDNQVL